MSIVVVDYDMGNVGSIVNMMKKIGHAVVVSRAADDIARAEKLILPGVGHFESGMEKIRSFGLVETLTRRVVEEKTPVLGICLGMQLMGSGSEEGRSAGLGWVPARSVRFSSAAERVPHMGWNTILPTDKPHWLFEQEPAETRFYFVHSYYVVCERDEDVIARCRYGEPFCAAFAHDHMLGVQFHPEKSHRFGMQLLRNFASQPRC